MPLEVKDFRGFGTHILCRGEDWSVSQNGQGVTLTPVGEQYLKEVSGILQPRRGHRTVHQRCQS
jgi:hypothetical protein